MAPLPPPPGGRPTAHPWGRKSKFYCLRLSTLKGGAQTLVFLNNAAVTTLLTCDEDAPRGQGYSSKTLRACPQGLGKGQICLALTLLCDTVQFFRKCPDFLQAPPKPPPRFSILLWRGFRSSYPNSERPPAQTLPPSPSLALKRPWTRPPETVVGCARTVSSFCACGFRRVPTSYEHCNGVRSVEPLRCISSLAPLCNAPPPPRGLMAKRLEMLCTLHGRPCFSLNIQSNIHLNISIHNTFTIFIHLSQKDPQTACTQAACQNQPRLHPQNHISMPFCKKKVAILMLCTGGCSLVTSHRRPVGAAMHVLYRSPLPRGKALLQRRSWPKARWRAAETLEVWSLSHTSGREWPCVGT